MTTSTPNLGLLLYNSSTDQAALFSTFRADIAGTALTSNFYKLDTAVGTNTTDITSLQSTRGAIPVPSTYSAPNTYIATVAAITAYSTGMAIILSVDTTTSGSATLNINSLGAKSLMKVNSAGTAIALTGSDLGKGGYYLFAYDGTRWLWVSANSADQIHIVGTSGNIVTVNTDSTLLGTTTPAALVGDTIHAAASKTTLVDADEVGGSDSESSYVIKKFTWANIKAGIWSALGALINGGTDKATPVDADMAAIADSAAANATKKVTLANLWLNYLKGKADALYAVLAHDHTTGSTVPTNGLTNNAVTNAKLAQMANATVKGRNTAATGDPEDVTMGQLGILLNIYDGTYTPSVTGVTNVAAITASVIYYQRSLSKVRVFGRVAVDPTTTGTTTYRMSLPIASDFTVSYQLAGMTWRTGANDEYGAVEGDATNNEATITYTATATTNHFIHIFFEYVIV